MSLLWIIFPTRCIICGEKLKNPKADICHICYNKIIMVTSSCCPKCGKPRQRDNEMCFDCSTRNHLFTKGRGMLVYDQVTKKSLSGLKFFGYSWIGKGYGKLLSRYYLCHCIYNIDLVLPVPIHYLRFIERGYNQANVIGESFSKELYMPYASNILKRKKNTIAQKELNSSKRYSNTKDAFYVAKRYIKDIQGKRILIIDDIYTTGATLDGCSKALLEAGAKEVYFLSVAIGDGL